MKKLLLSTFILTTWLVQVSANEIDNRLKAYTSEGASNFSAESGKIMWHKQFPDPKNPGKKRSCGTCHTDNLKAQGKHAKTGKTIDPLSPSVNKERFTEKKFIEKWFKRNCKWVVGRKCTAQEKGDFLSYLRSQ